MINILLTLPQNYTPAMYLYNQAFAYGSFTYSIEWGLFWPRSYSSSLSSS